MIKSEPRFEFCGRFRSVGFMLSSLDRVRVLSYVISEFGFEMLTRRWVPGLIYRH